jgi:hypothetical protein
VQGIKIICVERLDRSRDIVLNSGCHVGALPSVGGISFGIWRVLSTGGGYPHNERKLKQRKNHDRKANYHGEFG